MGYSNDGWLWEHLRRFDVGRLYEVYIAIFLEVPYYSSYSNWRGRIISMIISNNPSMPAVELPVEPEPAAG